MQPTTQGGLAYVEYDFINQHRNYSGTKSAPAANNDDKQIRTQFYTAGVQYMFNRKWGILGEAPYWQRYFKTTDGDTGNIVGFDHGSLGDIRLKAMYTGLSSDLSTGLTFGVKLPTGDYRYAYFDPDTQIGSGSPDLLLGAYRTARLTADEKYIWFASGQAELPVLHQAGYRPGYEVDGAVGAYLNGGRTPETTVAPLVQLLASQRTRDGGANSTPTDGGYSRLFGSRGIEAHFSGYRVYADVAFPVWQNVNGNQLMATEQFKVNVGRYF